MRTVTAASALEGTGYDDRLFEFPPALHPTTSSRGSLEPIIDRLFYDQKASWATVRENMAQLALFETSSLAMGADEVLYNSMRHEHSALEAQRANQMVVSSTRKIYHSSNVVLHMRIYSWPSIHSRSCKIT